MILAIAKVVAEFWVWGGVVEEPSSCPAGMAIDLARFYTNGPVLAEQPTSSMRRLATMSKPVVEQVSSAIRLCRWGKRGFCAALLSGLSPQRQPLPRQTFLTVVGPVDGQPPRPVPRSGR